MKKSIEDKVIRGDIKGKELIKLKLKTPGRDPRYYNKLANQFDYKEIFELAKDAIEKSNVNALRGLSEVNRLAVSNALQSMMGYKLLHETVEKGSYLAPELFFILKTTLQPYYKQLFKDLIKLVIFKESKKIAGRGLHGYYKHHTRFIQYKTGIDIMQTIMNLAGKPLEYMTAEDIVGIKRTRRRRACALILDTSGSMYGRLIFNAALTAAILSYHMKENEYSIVIFNTDAEVLKNIDEERNITKIVDSILETQASGFTNITAGLLKGHEQLKRARSRDKFAILITDGDANRGIKDMEKIASLFNKLHVIAIPKEDDKMTRGIRNCEIISRKGKGLLVKVSRFRDIPRALQRLLLKL
ncbi:MAG: vWA domain-containing protein [Promethearchaeota archaeon]